MSKHTLSVLVENKPGVLARIAALFSRRGFNIDSLAVGETEYPDVSRMTVVVDVEDLPLEQVTKQLNKLVEVLKVVELEPQSAGAAPGHADQGAGRRRHPQPGARDGADVPRQGRRRRHRLADHRGHRQHRQAQGPARRARALRRQGARPVRASSPSGAGRAPSPTGPCAAPDRPPTAPPEPAPAPATQPHGTAQSRPAPPPHKERPTRWPRCSTTTTPTWPSSRAARSRSSATAARATPTR